MAAPKTHSYLGCQQSPCTDLEILYANTMATERIVANGGISNIPHVDQHGLAPLPLPGSDNEFWLTNSNDGGVGLSTTRGASFTKLDGAFAGYNTSQFYGVSKKPGESVYFGGTKPTVPGDHSETPIIRGGG